jgi:ATP-dependent helicase HrpA
MYHGGGQCQAGWFPGSGDGAYKPGLVHDLRSIVARMPQTMLSDRPRLRRLLRAVELAGRSSKPVEEHLRRLDEAVERSIEARRRREALVPRPRYPSDLPVVQVREEVLGAIERNQVCVICGETGSGKTTQLPKFCLELGRGVAGMIGHTQPRRIAARTVAARIAEELGVEAGREVGFKVRFGDRTGDRTLIKVMTDGILLAETRGDPLLEQYDTIIIDEAHERSLNIDFLLGYLRALLPRRPDLKVIVTSATIDPERLAAHFAAGGVPAPVVHVSGRTYPVEVRYRPIAGDDPDDRERDQESAIVEAVNELCRASMPAGDVLVFLPGEREIRQTAEALRKHHPAGTEILPLYARLGAAEQMRVFAPHAGRRIVLATNVAETSLTVPGIRYVVDPGTARINRYNPRTRVQRLHVEPVSRASADQRTGRCGRLSEGVCIRLYSEEDYRTRPAFTDPEILRTSLASVILQMKSLNLGAVEEFPFIDRPDPRAVREGYDTLVELGAVDEGGALTPMGRQLARLPVDVRVGRIILAGHAEGALAEALVIAAALSVQDPRERPVAARERADEAHALFRDEQSDFLGLLRLWREWRERGRHLSWNRLRHWCHEHFLSFVRMREWEEVHGQLHALAGEMGLHPNTSPAAADPVHRAVLAGLLSNVAMRAPDSFEYRGASGNRISLHPSSALFRKGPRWIVAAELVHTTRLYARTVAPVRPEWIEELGAHLVKRSHSDPHWMRETGTVCAFERVTLYGLELAARRRVRFDRIDPVRSREIFIHHALMEGEWTERGDPMPAFVERNLATRARVRDLEARVRRRDILADAGAVYSFYDARIPPGVASCADLTRWLQGDGRRQAEGLVLTVDDLVRPGASAASPSDYPDALTFGMARLELSYAFEPGSEADGVTLRVPLDALPQVDPEACEWLVPGMLVDKLAALFRLMPRSLRRELEPIDATAERVAGALAFGRGSLFDAAAEKVKDMLGVTIPRSAWQPRGVPEHLRMSILLLDEKGHELARSRDAGELRERYAARARARVARSERSPFERDGVMEWDFGPLPERVEIARGDFRMVAYPAVVDRSSGVSLRLLDSAEEAARQTRRGVRRLFILKSGDELMRQVRIVREMPGMRLKYAPLGRPEDLERQVTELVAERAYTPDGALVRDPEEFERRLNAGWGRLHQAAREVAGVVSAIIEARFQLDLLLRRRPPVPWENAVLDLRNWVEYLMPEGFLLSTPWERLTHLPRYLSAAKVRYERLRTGLDRDRKAMAELAPLWGRYAHCVNHQGGDPERNPLLAEHRWLLEEYRVQLFAQELGTAQKVSPRRLDEHWVLVTGHGSGG